MADQTLRQQEAELVHPEPPATRPAQRPVRALLVTLVCSVVVLFASERLALRLAPPDVMEINSMFVLDAEVGWRFPSHHVIPRLEGWFGNTLELPFRTNNRGLKGTRDYPTPKPANQLRVIALGDSTANMVHFDGYPEFLERILSDALPDMEVWVQNAGVNGYSSLNTLFMAREEIPRFEPDYVIVTVGSDDAMLTNRRDITDYEVKSFGDALLRVGPHSRLVTWARRTVPSSLIQPVMNRPGARGDGKEIAREDMVTRTEPEEAKEYYAGIVDVARKHDAVPILTVQKWFFYDLKDTEYGGLHQPVAPWMAQVREVAEEKDVAYVNQVELLDRPDAAWFYHILPVPKGEEIGIMLDPIHLNLPGNELLAAHYARIILTDLIGKNPDLKVDFAPVDQVLAKYESRPTSDEGYLNCVPPDDFAEQVTEKARRANEGKDFSPWD